MRRANGRSRAQRKRNVGGSSTRVTAHRGAFQSADTNGCVEVECAKTLGIRLSADRTPILFVNRRRRRTRERSLCLCAKESRAISLLECSLGFSACNANATLSWPTWENRNPCLGEGLRAKRRPVASRRDRFVTRRYS